MIPNFLMADQDDFSQRNMDTIENEGKQLGENSVAEGATGLVEDQELKAIEAWIRELDEKADKLKQMKTEVNKQMNLSSPTSTIPGGLILPFEEKEEVDSRSIYVGNVDYGATAEELESHFLGYGFINRVTILCNKFNGHPKGFAYIEFADKDSAQTALAMDGSFFRGRQIKVNPKRTNRPGFSTTNHGFSRGRGGWGFTRGSTYGFSRSRRPRGFWRTYYTPYRF